MRKSVYHLRAIMAAQKARKHLLLVMKLVEDRHEEGEPRTPEELRLKVSSAMTWLQQAENEFAALRQNLQRELDFRTNECDPEVVRQRELEEELRRLKRQPRKRRSTEEITPEVLRLSAERLVPAAIADVLHVSEMTVRRILRKEQAA